MPSDLQPVPNRQLPTAERLGQLSDNALRVAEYSSRRHSRDGTNRRAESDGTRADTRSRRISCARQRDRHTACDSQQPLIRTIYNWGDDVAVITDKWMPSKERTDLQPSHCGPAKFTNDPVPRDQLRLVYDDIGYSKQLGRMVVCGRGDGAQLYQLTEQGWARFAEPIQGKEFRCAVEGDRSP